MIYDVLKSIGLPVAYFRFKNAVNPPFLIYLGNGQSTTFKDNAIYFKKNQYQVQYYFKQKNEINENQIEQTLIDNGYNYQKSEDIYIENEDLFVIYYDI